MTQFKVKTTIKVKKKPKKEVNTNPPLVKREYVEIPVTEFKAKDKVKILERFNSLYSNIDPKKSYTVGEYVNADLSNMNCGVIYLVKYPTQPFVSHHFKNA